MRSTSSLIAAANNFRALFYFSKRTQRRKQSQSEMSMERAMSVLLIEKVSEKKLLYEVAYQISSEDEEMPYV